MSELAELQKIHKNFYTTDPIAFNHLLVKMPQLRQCNFILEPCAGNGILADRISSLLKKDVDKYDVISRRKDIKEQNYLELNCKDEYDLIVTNFPDTESNKNNPIGYCELLSKALNDIAPDGYVCNFQKLKQLESKTRYEKIYSKYKPEIVFVYTFRMKCYNNGDMDQVYSPGIAYSWAVWHKDINGQFSKETKMDWIYNK